MRRERGWPAVFILAGLLSACHPDRLTSVPHNQAPSQSIVSGEQAGVLVTMTRVSTGGTLWGIAIRSDGVGLATDLGNHLVVFDTRTQTVTGSIAVGSCPTAVTFSADGAKALVASQCSNVLDIVDMTTRTLIGSVPVQGSPITVVAAPDNIHAYVGTGSSTLVTVNVVTQAVESTIAIAGALNGLALNAAGTILYISNTGTVVYEFDPIRVAFRRTFTLPNVTQGLTLSASKTHLIVASESGFLSDINLTTGGRLTLPLAGGPFGVAEIPPLARTAIMQPGTGDVTVYDEKTFAFRQTLHVGGFPRRGAFDAGSRTLVVTDVGGDLIFIK